MITNDDDTLMIISRSKKTTIFNFSLTAWGKEKGGGGRKRKKHARFEKFPFGSKNPVLRLWVNVEIPARFPERRDPCWSRL